MSKAPVEHTFYVQREPRSEAVIALYKRSTTDTESARVAGGLGPVSVQSVQRFFFGQWLAVMHDPMQTRAALGMLGPKHIEDALTSGRLYEAADTQWKLLLDSDHVRDRYASSTGSFLQQLNVLISPKDVVAATAGDWTNVELRAMCVTKHSWATVTSKLIVESGELLCKPFGMYVASPKAQFFNTAGAAKKQAQETLNELSDQLAVGGEPPLLVTFPINGLPVTKNVTGWINDREAKEHEEKLRQQAALIARAEELKKQSATALNDGDFAERMRAKRAAKGGV